MGAKLQVVKGLAPQTTDSLLTYCLKVAALSLVANLALSGAAQLAAHALGLPRSIDNRSLTGAEIIGTLLLAPLVESVLLRAACALARTGTRAVWLPSLFIGVIAGLAHGALDGLRFFGPMASFTVFAWAWLRWHDARRAHGFMVLLLPHVLHNAVPIGVLASAGPV